MIGEILGNVRITTEIGQGAMGMVYLAQHVNVGKPFAVRHLSPRLSQDPRMRQRLLNQARVLSRLRHDNIVRIYDVIEKDTDLFWVMEYVEGQGLDMLLKRGGALPLKEALVVGKAVLKALNFANSKGIAGRGLRPSGILVTKDFRVKIADYGFSPVAEDEAANLVAARYMSPEQFEDAASVDARADVYAVGVIFYEMLTGEVPFDGESVAEIREKHLKAPLPDLVPVSEGVSPEFKPIVLKALEKKPEDRYRGCVDFLRYLQAFEGGTLEQLARETDEKQKGAGAEEVPEAEVPRPTVKRMGPRTRIAVAAGVLLLVVAAVFVTLHVMASRRMKAEYEAVLARVEAQKDPAKKIVLLAAYAGSHAPGPYTERSMERIRALRALVEKRDYETAERRAAALAAEKAYEAALAVYDGYLKRHPSGGHSGEVRRRAKELTGRMDERDFKRIQGLEKEDYPSRIRAYSRYLKAYPEGRHRAEVKQLLAGIGAEYYDFLKSEIPVCDQVEAWDDCIRLCDHFISNLADSPHRGEVMAMRAALVKKAAEKADLAALMKKASKAGTVAAKRIYTAYLEAHPDVTGYMSGKIRGELRRLEKKREWELLAAAGENGRADLSGRIDRLDRYVRRNPSGKYTAAARAFLKRLRAERRRRLQTEQRLAAEKRRSLEDGRWNRVLAAVEDPGINVFERIRRMETYLAGSVPARYAGRAREKLAALRAEGKEWVRRDAIRKKLTARIEKPGEVYVDNGDGTLLDRRTGLTWCLLDSTDVTGKCLDYRAAARYVGGLRTGGRSDWRLPTARELALIYKGEPFFPSLTVRWYWSSDTRGKASWQTVYVVDSRKDRTFRMETVNVKKCGTVRAVRP